MATRDFHLVHVITRFQLGGAEEVAVALSCSAARDGCGVTVCAVLPTESEFGIEQSARLQRNGVNCVCLSSKHSKLQYACARLSDATGPMGGASKLQLLSSAIRLAKIVRMHSHPIIHLHTDIPDFVGSLARRLCNFPIARTIHNTALWQGRRAIPYFVESAFKNDLVISVSSAAQRAHINLRRQCNLPISGNQKLNHNGVGRPCFGRDAARRVLSSVVDWNLATVNFCFAGRLTKQKGFDLLVSALTKMKKSDTHKLRVHVFSPIDANWYAFRERTTGLPITFYRPIPQLRDYFGAFDALILPSRYEGYPLVAAEALAAETPVLASSAEGVEEVLPDGWLLKFQSGNDEALAELISAVCQWDNTSKESERVKVKSVELQTMERMWEMYLDAYREYLKQYCLA